MAKHMLGAPVAQAMCDRINRGAAKLKEIGVTPTVAIVRVGAKAPDLAYERNFTKKAESLNIRVTKTVFNEGVTEAQLLEALHKINENPEIHGCLLFRPLPKHLNTQAVLSALRPEKDIDAMTSASIGGLMMETGTYFPPCTSQACLEILDFYHVPIVGTNAVVVGSSMAVGLPTSIMLINADATVTSCHSVSDPERVRELCRQADIIVSAVGKAGLITKDYVSPGQAIIDVGINVGADGKLCGDVDFDAVEPIVDAITPVPRGVGAVTTTVLASHAVQAAMNASGLVY